MQIPINQNVYETPYPIPRIPPPIEITPLPGHVMTGRQGLIPIAPDPVSLRQMNAQKRMREEEEYSKYGQRKRKRTPSQSDPVELNEEEQLLLRLKEEENLPWKDIAVRFQTDLGKMYQVPALQMRLKRLRERMRAWSETDVSFEIFLLLPIICVLILRKAQALEQAYEYWEKFQFDIIAAKVYLFRLNYIHPSSRVH